MRKRYSEKFFVKEYIQACNKVFGDYYGSSSAGWKKITTCYPTDQIKEKIINSKLSIIDSMCKDIDVLMNHLCCFE